MSLSLKDNTKYKVRVRKGVSPDYTNNTFEAEFFFLAEDGLIRFTLHTNTDGDETVRYIHPNNVLSVDSVEVDDGEEDDDDDDDDDRGVVVTSED